MLGRSGELGDEVGDRCRVTEPEPGDRVTRPDADRHVVWAESREGLLIGDVIAEVDDR